MNIRIDWLAHAREKDWRLKKNLGLKVLVGYCFMESTCQNLTDANSTNEKTLASTKVSIGISLRACVAKAKEWTLEKANAPPIHKDSINKMT